MTVNIHTHDPDALAAERQLIVGYAPPAARAGFVALLALDERLGSILRSTREPLVGQMRLTWWYEALTALNDDRPPAEPVLQTLAGDVLTRGIAGDELAAMIDGWEALIDADILDAPAMVRHAAARGGILFTLAGRLFGAAAEPLAVAGEGWALADLSTNLSAPESRSLAASLARERLAIMGSVRWSRPVRPLSAMALAARMDVSDQPRPPGHPARVGRLMVNRLTGR
ncbi:hypothetical protein GCM10022268_33000 [Sphingomonas cynarae]|uniref:Phytoene synthase n=1 Tax=Sphingomonas cynarae TaxID=930197 RepID=A0ABP7ERR2_9SPHN